MASLTDITMISEGVSMRYHGNRNPPSPIGVYRIAFPPIDNICFALNSDLCDAEHSPIDCFVGFLFLHKVDLDWKFSSVWFSNSRRCCAQKYPLLLKTSARRLPFAVQIFFYKSYLNSGVLTNTAFDSFSPSFLSLRFFFSVFRSLTNILQVS